MKISHGSEILLQTDKGPMKFTFDRVFAPSEIGGLEWTQKAVFEFAGQPIIEDIFTGYNGTIFAYGQTGSGKTHTMQGPSLQDQLQQGIIPRAIHAIFDRIYKTDEHIEFTVQVSYVEIYLERVRDLLDPKKHNLGIREHPTRGVYVEGMSEEYVTSPSEMFYFLDLGATNRATSATGMNEGSSRSHSVFVVAITQKDTQEGTSRRGNLYLVDLAGSEMVRKTGASGQQLEEAKMINKSLSALGNVINALTDANASHVPYRNSKLTRMLQESLGGNARTALIICCSPSSYNAPEILSTLRFGNRAKAIQNKARVNETRSVEQLTKLLEKSEQQNRLYKKQIASLKAKVKKYRQAAGLPDAFEDEEDDFVSTEELKVKLAHSEKHMETLEAELKQATDEIGSLSAIITEKDMEISLEHKAKARLQAAASEQSEQLDEALSNAKDFAARIAQSLKMNGVLRELTSQEEEPDLKILQDQLSFELKERMITSATQKKQGYIASHNELMEKNQRLETEVKLLREQVAAASVEAQRHAPEAETKAEPGIPVAEHEVLREQFDKNRKNTELLVGFHRTLLRRYATLEYELCDANDKLQVRSQRIKELEQDYKQLMHNAKVKAKLHLNDMAKMRSEHEKKLSQMRTSSEPTPRNIARRVRGKAPDT